MGKGKKPKPEREYKYKNGIYRTGKDKEPQEDFTPEQTLRWLRSIYRSDERYLSEHGYKKAHGNSISGLPKKIGEK